MWSGRIAAYSEPADLPPTRLKSWIAAAVAMAALLVGWTVAVLALDVLGPPPADDAAVTTLRVATAAAS